MQRITKIVLFILVGYLHADVLPEDGAMLNYTQVFIMWEQIPYAENYQITIQKMSTGEEYLVNTPKNSILLTDFLDWNSTYDWFVCGLFSDNYTPFCSEIYSFDINPLPDYFPDGINVLSYNESLSQTGITVMDFESLNFSGSLDKDGYPVWFSNKDNFQERFVFRQFLQNGNMIGFGPGKGYEIDLDGNIVFETPDGNSVHHDFNKTINNTYFLISATVEDQYCPEECNPSLPDEIPWQGDKFREFDQDGNEIWSWNTFDYYDLIDYNPYYVEIYTGSLDMDWTHSNSVFFDENSASVFVSVRNLSRITKIDYASKNLIWNLGETDFMNEIYFEQDLNFSQQHSVQVLDNGNLLFFDNHRYLTPELSRCIEVAYDESDYNAEIIWEHQLPLELFSGSRGECDRLENGNTLITAGRTGTTLEVTPDNVVVWQLEVDNMGFDVSMYRSERILNLYPIAFSVSLDHYIGDIENPYVEPVNNTITAKIHNNGWSEGWYIYTLRDLDDIEILSDSIFVDSFNDTELSINIANFILVEAFSILTLDIYPGLAPERLQTFEFNLHNLSFGDLNGDAALNVLDIIILVNLILADDSSNPEGDLNQDGNQDILDIVTLVTLIIDN